MRNNSTMLTVTMIPLYYHRIPNLLFILLLTNIISLVVTGSVAYIITHDKDIKASEQDGGMKPSSMEFMKMAMYGLKAQGMEEKGERSNEGRAGKTI